MVKCVNCANYYYDIMPPLNGFYGFCRAKAVGAPGLDAGVERECGFFRQKGGTSKWDLLDDSEKEALKTKAKEMYKDEFEEFWGCMVSELKKTDINCAE